MRLSAKTYKYIYIGKGNSREILKEKMWGKEMGKYKWLVEDTTALRCAIIRLHTKSRYTAAAALCMEGYSIYIGKASTLFCRRAILLLVMLRGHSPQLHFETLLSSSHRQLDGSPDNVTATTVSASQPACPYHLGSSLRNSTLLLFPARIT